MKLYTEEQVREALDNEDVAYISDIVIAQMQPIELPSDEEIEETFTFYPQIIEGAKWMRDKILKK